MHACLASFSHAKKANIEKEEKERKISSDWEKRLERLALKNSLDKTHQIAHREMSCSFTWTSLVEATALETLHADIARLAIRHLRLHLDLFLNHAVSPT